MMIKNGRKKKVVLIESKSPGSHIFSMVLLPRIGIVLLATILRDIGYEVIIFIENFHEINWKIVQEADLVCISVITCTSVGGYKIAQRCKEMGKTVIIGGSHPTFMAEEATQYADYVCIGESEWSFPELAGAILEGDADPRQVKGIAYRIDNPNGQFIKTEKARAVLASDLDKFPFPDFSLIYGKPKKEITPIMSSRGCPHDCDFCSVIVMFGREMRYRSEESVISEIKHQKPNYIFFYDDNFTINQKRTINILEEKMRLPGSNHLTWSAQVDVGLAKNEELVKLMKRSGCEYVYVGFESISDETLKAYNKKQNIESIRKFMEVFRRNKIDVHGMFVLDPRNDNSNYIDEVSEFIKKEKISTVQLLNLTPLPGTPLWAREEKNLLTRDWNLFDAHHVVLPAQKMTSYEMQMKTIRAMNDFYSLPRAGAALLQGNLLVAKLRAAGWHIAGKWAKNNKDFLDYLGWREKFVEVKNR